MVRAKFKCTSITRREGWGEFKEIRDIELQVVCGGSDDNKKFFAASPSGSIKLGCANAAASEQFEIGKEYYVDFTPANS